MEGKVVRGGRKKLMGWIAVWAAVLALSAVGSYHLSVFKNNTQYTGERASDSQILMADGNNPKTGGG